MSYDLAVWEGSPPADDDAATAIYEDLCSRYLYTAMKPNDRIAEYVAALLERWRDITEYDDDEGEHSSPWAYGPLIDEASGPLIYFPLVRSMAAEASAYAADLASSMGLICYDPQWGQVRSSHR